MAIENTLGVWEFPVGSGKMRTFYQGHYIGATNTTYTMLPTISANGSFVLCKALCNIYDPELVDPEIIIKNDTVIKHNSTSIKLNGFFDFLPFGIRSAVSNTLAAVYDPQSDSVGASIIVIGYMDEEV